MLWTNAIILLVASVRAQVRTLETYNADPVSMSVSGFSSGSSMATQVHIAFSQHMVGAGLFSGSPYMCYPSCSGSTIDLPALWAQTAAYDDVGLVDSVINMRDDRVYVYNGLLDTTVPPDIAQPVADYYGPYMASWEQQATVVYLDARHSMITSHYGVGCALDAYPWISNCDYKGAYNMLNHIYTDITEPNAYGEPLAGDFYQFDQTEFFVGRGSGSMDNVGFVYVPSACVGGETQCRVHVIYHGCGQGRVWFGDIYAANTGYNEVGELNNIIMVYPQATWTPPVNPNGCWDWWGYNTGGLYGTKCGHQMMTTCEILERLTGSSGICGTC